MNTYARLRLTAHARRMILVLLACTISGLILGHVIAATLRGFGMEV